MGGLLTKVVLKSNMLNCVWQWKTSQLDIGIKRKVALYWDAPCVSPLFYYFNKIPESKGRDILTPKFESFV